MTPHPRIGGSWLFLMLAWAAPAGPAPEAAAPNGPSAPSVATTAVAPAPASTATSATPKARPRLSPETAGQVLSVVPVWNPPPVEPAKKTPPPDAEIVKLDPLIVLGERLPRTDKIDWLTPEAKDLELVKTYITPFDRYFLDRFTLPILGISKEARAQMMYEEYKRLREMQWMNEQIEQIKRLDPQEAKALLSLRNAAFTRSQEY
jgi:hypothetical protein